MKRLKNLCLCIDGIDEFDFGFGAAKQREKVRKSFQKYRDGFTKLIAYCNGILTLNKNENPFQC